MAKVLTFNIPKPDNSGLIFQIDEGEMFFDKLHQHEEIQISYIVQGKGTLIVGDAINEYSDGDVVVIGSGVPHVFRSLENNSANSRMLTLFFTRRSFGEAFFELEILHEINPFFERSNYGIKLTSNIQKVRNLFCQIDEVTVFGRFLILLQILNLLNTSNYESLSSFIGQKKYNRREGMRMQRVFDFILNNYTEDIDLTDVSQVAHMTKNAFCKYFKKRTNKTFVTFLNELRIEHAARLLRSRQDLSVAEIANQSGFKNISNFNRTFRRVKKEVPSVYSSGIS